MIYGSVCSGIEAATVAWHPLGWTPAWFSEIDPFPCAVLAHHYPGVPNLGDMTTIRGRTDVPGIDMLVGGTPCQSFSVAGLRAGMDDPRGQLALVYLGIADRLRPRWIVWENVPGVLSSNGGRDFGAFLGALGQLGYGWAYRVLDAQYVRVDGFARAVPQRRRRVFVVGHLGDYRRAAAVLFEPKSLCGDTPPRREAGQGTAHDTSPSLVSSGRGVERVGETRGQDPVVAVANPLTARMHKGVNTTMDEGQTMGVAPCLRSNYRNNSDPGMEAQMLVAHPLRAAGHDASEDGTGRGTPLVATGYHETGKGWWTEGVAGLRAEPGGMPENVIAFTQNQAGDILTGAVCPSMGTNQNATGRNTPKVMAGGVRRLTPRECERLQGFPTCIDRVIIRAWFDRDGTRLVRAALCYLSVLSSALPAGESERCGSVWPADVTFWNDPASLGSAVAVHVRTGHAPQVHRVLSRGRCIWSASGARDASSYPLSMPADAIALAIARLEPSLDLAVPNGGAASPAPTRRSTPPEIGNWPVVTFGPESGGDASGADSKRGAATRSTIASPGHATQPFDLTAQTLLCSVVHATTSFIPRETRAASFCEVVLDNERDYTLVPYRNKPAADAPRYKALGNSMAVNCMRWIGERIKQVEETP